MFLFLLCLSSFFMSPISLTVALIIPSIQDIANSPPLAPSTNNTFPELLLLTPDIPILKSNSSLNVDYSTPVCNGSLLGFDVNRYSCLQAWNTIPTSDGPLTFGDRSKGSFDVQLPHRFSGPDGTCVVDIFHKDGAPSDTASYQWISRAAEKLYSYCVGAGERTQGGYIRDIGQDKNLVIVLSAYTPSVSCFGPKFNIRGTDPALQRLLSILPVTTDRQSFGPEGEPGVQVVVPITYSVPSSPTQSRTLRLTVDVPHRHAVTARWFDVWAGAVAVAAACATRGYAGISGLESGLDVTLEAVMAAAAAEGGGVAAS